MNTTQAVCNAFFPEVSFKELLLGIRGEFVKIVCSSFSEGSTESNYFLCILKEQQSSRAAERQIVTTKTAKRVHFLLYLQFNVCDRQRQRQTQTDKDRQSYSIKQPPPPPPSPPPLYLVLLGGIDANHGLGYIRREALPTSHAFHSKVTHGVNTTASSNRGRG